MVKQLTKIDHVLRSVDRVTYRYKNSPKLAALLLSIIEETNLIEDQLELMQTELSLYSSTGENLKYWADTLKVPTSRPKDAEYRQLVLAYLQMWLSEGNSPVVKGILNAGLSGTDARVWNTETATFQADVYNPDLPVDEVVLEDLIVNSPIVGVRCEGVNLIPANYGFLAFENTPYLTSESENFNPWPGFTFSSYVPDGSTPTTVIGTNLANTAISVLCDDSEFYDAIIATGNESLIPLNYKFYTGSLPVTNRIQFKSGNLGATAQIRFDFPLDPGYYQEFEDDLRSVMDGMGTIIIYDDVGTKLTIEKLTVDPLVGFTSTTRTVNEVQYRRAQWSVVTASTRSSYKIYIDDVEILGNNVTVASAFSDLSSYSLNDAEQFFFFNPNGITTGTTQTGTGDPIVFTDKGGVTWSILAGATATRSFLKEEWQSVNLDLTDVAPADNLVNFYFNYPSTLPANVPLIGFVQNDDSSIDFIMKLADETINDNFVSSLAQAQLLTFRTPSLKKVTILTPTSDLQTVGTNVKDGGIITITIPLRNTFGDNPEGVIFYSTSSVQDQLLEVVGDNYTYSDGATFTTNNPAVSGDPATTTDFMMKYQPTSEIITSTGVLRNNVESHAYAILETMMPYNTDDKFTFYDKNSWGFLKSNYPFTTVDPRPIRPGRYSYFYNIVDTNSAYIWPTGLTPNYGDRVALGWVAGSQTRTLQIYLEDGAQSTIDFQAQLNTNLVTSLGSVSYLDASQGRLIVFEPFTTNTVPIATTTDGDWLILVITLTANGTDYVKFTFDNQVVTDYAGAWQWGSITYNSSQEAAWNTYNSSGFQLGVGTATGEIREQGEDTGHITEKVYTTNFTGTNARDLDSIRWASGIVKVPTTSDHEAYGYQVSDGQGAFPSKEATNSWRDQVYQWIDYHNQYINGVQKNKTDLLKARMDNLPAAGIIHNAVIATNDEGEFDLLGATLGGIGSKDFRMSGQPAGTLSLSLKSVAPPFVDYALSNNDGFGDYTENLNASWDNSDNFTGTSALNIYMPNCFYTPRVDLGFTDTLGRFDPTKVSDYEIKQNVNGYLIYPAGKPIIYDTTEYTAGLSTGKLVYTTVRNIGGGQLGLYMTFRFNDYDEARDWITKLSEALLVTTATVIDKNEKYYLFYAPYDSEGVPRFFSAYGGNAGYEAGVMLCKGAGGLGNIANWEEVLVVSGDANDYDEFYNGYTDWDGTAIPAFTEYGSLGDAATFNANNYDGVITESSAEVIPTTPLGPNSLEVYKNNRDGSGITTKLPQYLDLARENSVDKPYGWGYEIACWQRLGDYIYYIADANIRIGDSEDPVPDDLKNLPLKVVMWDIVNDNYFTLFSGAFDKTQNSTMIGGYGPYFSTMCFVGSVVAYTYQVYTDESYYPVQMVAIINLANGTLETRKVLAMAKDFDNEPFGYQSPFSTYVTPYDDMTGEADQSNPGDPVSRFTLIVTGMAKDRLMRTQLTVNAMSGAIAMDEIILDNWLAENPAEFDDAYIKDEWDDALHQEFSGATFYDNGNWYFGLYVSPLLYNGLDMTGSDNWNNKGAHIIQYKKESGGLTVVPKTQPAIRIEDPGVSLFSSGTLGVTGFARLASDDTKVAVSFSSRRMMEEPDVNEQVQVGTGVMNVSDLSMATTQSLGEMGIVSSDIPGWDPSGYNPGAGTDRYNSCVPLTITNATGYLTVGTRFFPEEPHVAVYSGIYTDTQAPFELEASLTSGIDGIGTVKGNPALQPASQAYRSGLKAELSWAGGAYIDYPGVSAVNTNLLQGDDVDLKLTGWFDPLAIKRTDILNIVTTGSNPYFETRFESTDIDGKSIKYALDYLYANTPSEFNLNYDFLGGNLSLPAFDNHVTGLAGGDSSYLEENATLVANTPYTVNHTLGEMLVVADVYTYPSGVTHNCEVRLLNNNSLTITSSTNATVSIFVKA